MSRREPLYHVAEWVLRPTLKPLFRYHFEGMEHFPERGPLLVASNHISHLDPLAQALMIDDAGRRPRFLAKAELFRNPILRRILVGTRQIRVDRGSGSSAPLDQAVAALRQGEVVVVYPEATLTGNPDHSPMPGKTGIARLTLWSGVPVMPMAVWGTHLVWNRDGFQGLKLGRPVWTKASAPMDFSEHAGTRDDPAVLRTVTDMIMAEIGRLVADLRSRYPKE